MNSIKTHGLRTILAVLFLLTLAACGGGGGGSGGDPTPTTVTCADGTTAPAVAQCPVPTVAITPADGAINVDPATFALVLSSNARLSQNVVVVEDGRAITGTSTLSTDQKTVTFVPTAKPNFGEMHVFQVTVTDTDDKSVMVATTVMMASVPAPACPVVGTTWNGTQCAFPTVHYTDKVFATYDLFSRVYALTTSGIAMVVSGSAKYTTGFAPLAGCGFGPKLSTGQVLVDCIASSDLQWHLFYLDPSESTPTLRDYAEITTSVDNKDGSVTFTYVDPLMGVTQQSRFVSVGPYDPSHPSWSVSTTVAAGTFYAAPESCKIYFQANDGTVTAVKLGTFETDGNTNVLESYSN